MVIILVAVIAALVVMVGAGFVVRSSRSRRGELAQRPSRPIPPAPPAPPPPVRAAEAPPVVRPEEPPEPVPPAAPEEVVAAEVGEKRPRLSGRLEKTRNALGRRLAGLRQRSGLDEAGWEELEEALLGADVGVATTMSMLTELRARVSSKELTSPSEVLGALRDRLIEIMSEGDHSLDRGTGSANLWLFVGVNGVGKTTTIGKVARRESAEGRSVVMAAGDTFRAAAGEQLATWAERAGVDLVRGSEGGDPAAVVFDAVQRASARGIEMVLADTAGRLHTKSNLMDELRKVRRVAERPPAQLREVLLVLDATTGQNGLIQARNFTEAVGVTGVVLTKLDGTAKGGIAVAVQSELGLPIKLVGVGEGVDDLVDFDPAEFVAAIFDGVGAVDGA